jgi:hypothetical protein
MAVLLNGEARCNSIAEVKKMNNNNNNNNNNNEKMSSQERKTVPDSTAQIEGSGEYGIEQFLVPKEEDLVKARKLSSYHYSQNQLQHKHDRIDDREEEK